MNKKELFSIPNILTMIRIILVIVFAILFFNQLYFASGIVLISSGVTDVLDGFIARRFNMITKIGKALDPFADKLTQITVLICLAQISLLTLIPAGILILRDAAMLVTGISIFKRTNDTFSALWYGKVATLLTYCLMCAMLVFKTYFDENQLVLIILIGIDSLVILFSFIMYMRRNYMEIKRLETLEKIHDRENENNGQ